LQGKLQGIPLTLPAASREFIEIFPSFAPQVHMNSRAN
jgi:hypothetical protein